MSSTLSGHRASAKIKVLVGSGARIGLVTLPFLAVGLIANIAFPRWFTVGGPPAALTVLSVAVLLTGVAVWAWSVTLILTKVPRGQLMTSGPYALVRHPLYTGVALLVLPWLGFLCDSWLGVVLGTVLYLASRRYAADEEAVLARRFGTAWEAYRRSVLIPWL